MAPFSGWRPLVETELTAVPERPGVFEIGTLVRSLLLVGSATDSLAATLGHYANSPGQLQHHVGRLYFRYAPSDEPDRLQTEVLSGYRERHGGALPPAQATPAPTRSARLLKAV
jgi:hypothetical protein